MGDNWRRRLEAEGYTQGQWMRARRHVAGTLPQPCTVCGDAVHAWQRWHLDHITPLTRGGAALSLDNLGPAHAHCNLVKGNGKSAARYPTVPPSKEW